MKRIALLHYASPPTIGGVETTIAYQARELVRCGYEVRVISGSGGLFEKHIEVYVDPQFGSTSSPLLALKAELDAGIVSPAFEATVAQIEDTLRLVLHDCDVCIVHNTTTLHKNLALTAALFRLSESSTVPLISWCHDLAWTNPQYQAELHDGYPWELLRQVWPNTRYVTVSEPRRQELAELLNTSPDSIEVVVPGIDLSRFFHWTPLMEQLALKLHLVDADGLLLLPARITRRKNIGLGLEVLAAVREKSGRDFRLIVTGPPGPHNPANRNYLDELLSQRRKLGLENAAHFLYAHNPAGDTPLLLDDDTMANLYQIADALVFPSTQEGFGIPVLEAGIAGIPVICADIPALRGTAQGDGVYFDPNHDTPETIATRVLDVLSSSAASRLRMRVRKTYRWDVIVREQLIPLLET